MNGSPMVGRRRLAAGYVLRLPGPHPLLRKRGDEGQRRDPHKHFCTEVERPPP